MSGRQTYVVQLHDDVCSYGVLYRYTLLRLLTSLLSYPEDALEEPYREHSGFAVKGTGKQGALFRYFRKLAQRYQLETTTILSQGSKTNREKEDVRAPSQ